MLPSEAGSNAISASTKVDVRLMGSTTNLPTSEVNQQKTLISLSRYNNLLFIERHVSSIIDYKVQQILAAEAAIERASSR